VANLPRIAVAVLALAAGVAAQLPAPFVPPQNPQTPAKIVLGKILFWEEQLSSDDSVACGTCHLPEFGGSDGRVAGGLHPGADNLFGTADDIRGSAGVVKQAPNGDFAFSSQFGVRRQATGRTSPSMIGAAHHTELFWDGRAGTQFLDPETGAVVIPIGGALENQAIGPILNPVEMGKVGRTWQDVRQKLQAATPLRLASNLPADVAAAIQQSPSYPLLFTAAFGDPAITGARIGMALASYQRTLNPDDTPWDRYMAGQTSALTAAQKTGWQLFQNQGRCAACHWAPLFSDDLFHNLGVRFVAEDVGRGQFTPYVEDQGAFKTPTLRNVGLRPRLFHNGQSPALGDPAQWTDANSTLNVYFNGGGVDPSNLDPFMLPLNLLGVSINDVALIQDFVRDGLTDQRAALRLPPFDHPDLRSAGQAPPRVFGPSLAGQFEPRLIDSVPAYPGNADFKLGLAAGVGPTSAIVTWGFTSIEPSASLAGLPWQLNVAGWNAFALNGPPGRPGLATWRLPVPNDPGLATVPLYFQLLAIDPSAPGGIAASSGWEFFVR
jgi:cytochrome c peroxidase